jgi:hypothetical protein
MPEVTRDRIARELREERESLTAYLESLPEAAWDKQSRAPTGRSKS